MEHLTQQDFPKKKELELTEMFGINLKEQLMNQEVNKRKDFIGV